MKRAITTGLLAIGFLTMQMQPASAAEAPTSQGFGPDHVVVCVITPGAPFVSGSGVLRRLYSPGTLECYPSPPDTSSAYIQVQRFDIGVGWVDVGAAAWYRVPTVYHYWKASISCPNPLAPRKLYRTKMYGFLSEDGVQDDATAYSGKMGAAC